MSLFSELLNEVADANSYPLDNCLLRAKLLASRLPGRKFRQWVDAELSGYPNADAVPPYRRVRTQAHGHFSGAFGRQMRNVKLSFTNFGDVREELESFYFIDNVGALQAMLAAETDTFHNRLDIEMIDLYRRAGDVRVDGMILQDAHRIITKPAVRGVLHAIRNRLLDFLIELRDRHPDLEESDAAASKVTEEELSLIVDRRIYNNCSITDGSHAVTRQVVAGGDINVAGDFVLADRIEGSFLKAAGAGQGNELAGLMRRLAESVKALGQALPEEQQREAAQNYDVLAAEVGKAAPRKEWLKLAGEGLAGMASAAGEQKTQEVVGLLLRRLGA